MNFNRLVSEWAWRVNDGMPDPKNRTHVELLRQVLIESGYSEDFVLEYTQNLIEVDDDKMIKYKDEDGKSKTMKASSAKTQDNEHPAKIAWNKLQDKGDSEPDEKEKEVDDTKLSAKDGDFIRKAGEDKKTSGFEAISAYQDETSGRRDKGEAGAGGAVASQGESRFGNALDTLNEEEFRAQNKDAIKAEKENVKSK